MSNKMTFPELAGKIAEKTGAEQGTIISLLEETTNQIRQSLSESGTSHVQGLGKFRLKWQNERTGRNPQTGESIEIPAHNRIMFTPEKSVREFINRDYAHLKPRVLEDPSSDAKSEVEAAPAAKPKSETVRKVEKSAAPKPVSRESKSPPPKQESEKKSSKLWMWLALAAVLIIFFILFNPFGKDGSAKEEQAQANQTELNAAPGEQTTEHNAAVENEEIEKAAPAEKTEPAAENKPAKQVPVSKLKIIAEETINSLDNLSGIAKKHFATAKFWPLLVTVNSDAIDNPDDLNEKVSLQIPDFKSSFDKLTPAEKHQLAAGFLDTYLKYKALGKAKAVGYLWVSTQIGNGSLIEKYKSKIDKADLNRAKNMSGKLSWK